MPNQRVISGLDDLVDLKSLAKKFRGRNMNDYQFFDTYKDIYALEILSRKYNTRDLDTITINFSRDLAENIGPENMEGLSDYINSTTEEKYKKAGKIALTLCAASYALDTLFDTFPMCTTTVTAMGLTNLIVTNSDNKKMEAAYALVRDNK